jgi:type IV pilus modification protein PilV
MIRERSSRGFTLIEVLVSLVVVIIGMFGVMAVLRTTGRANRLARQLSGATACATQILEDVRATDPSKLGTSGTYADQVASDGTTYHRRYAVATIPTASTVVMITATATFNDDVDGSLHTASLQLIRTTKEKL